VENTQALDEVVVVGYGTQKKGNLTAAISTIKAAEIQTTTATSIAHKLQGKMPGLNIRQNTGEPGVYDNAINIRGFGSPLYVIDGIQRPASVFQRINGADIENISILKDAAAAVYGINAANGVVIVTTKHGGKGKTDFQFSSTVGFSTPTDVPRMCNAYEYFTLRNEANINIGLEPFISREELEKWKIGGPGYESTDWAGATFNDYSMRQEYNLSAEGGTDKLSYYFDLSGAFDNGMLKTNDLFYQRLSFRSNISAQLTDRIKAVVNIAAVNDKRESSAFGIYETWRGVISSLPTKKIYANDNPLYLNRVQDGQAMNPVALMSSDLTGYSRSNNNDYITSLELSYDVPFVKGLELKGIVAYDKAYNMGKHVAKDFALYDYDLEADTYKATKFNDPASINNSYSNVYYTTVRGQADYKTVYKDDHNISATLVYEVKDAAERHASLLKYFDFYTNDQIDQAGNTNAQSGGNEWHTRNMSYIGRANYDYKGRYLIEFAGRYDGSYRYHPDQRWGFFPLVSAGWRISDEKFMKPFYPVLSNLKLRASYGKIGEDAGNPFQYVPGFTTGGGWWEFSDGKTTLGLNTPAIVNEKLSWMNSVLTDIGIDLGFFNNKLEVTFDWYQKNRSGLLAYRNVSLPNTYGGSFPQENLNKDRVRGFDFSFDYKNIIGDLNYKISGNFNYARNMAVYIEQGNYANSWDVYRWNQVGRYQGVVWNYHVVGQYKSEEEILAGAVQNGNLGNRYVLPGDFIYEDVNGDNVFDGNDARPHFYDASPKMNYGLTLGASWKGLDVSVLFQGAALFSIRLTHAYTTMFWQEANVPAYFMDRWHKEDPYDSNSSWIPGKWPAMRTTDQTGALYEDSDAWRRDCSYVRLKNIGIGYTFPQLYSKKIGLDNLRLFVDVNNIYTWADSFIKPFDPEKVGGAYDAGWTYPIMRTFNIGLDINF
jgi:TonB-linked SusC/RagA family outer membrane protein